MSLNAPRPVSLYVIDDEAIVRAGLRALLERIAEFTVVGDSGDARRGIEEIAALRPDLAIVDIAMPGLSGLDAIAAIKKASRRTKVLIASQHESRAFVHRALSAGADGYLSKSSDPDELRIAVLSIHDGESFVSPRVVGSLVDSLRGGVEASGGALDVLSPREREVFQLVAIGRTNKDIAAVLNVSLGTVKKHRENLQRKLKCGSAAEIARMAIREGLVSP